MSLTLAPPAPVLPMIANGVILADNDSLMRSVIRSVLVQVDMEVFPVANGMEALALARGFRARLVLLDIAMPLLNGLLACKAIRELPGYGRVPIVMLTGHDDPQMRAAAATFGATDFITKPIQPDALLARLAGCLELSPSGKRGDLARGWDVLRVSRGVERLASERPGFDSARRSL